MPDSWSFSVERLTALQRASQSSARPSRILSAKSCSVRQRDRIPLPRTPVTQRGAAAAECSRHNNCTGCRNTAVSRRACNECICFAVVIRFRLRRGDVIDRGCAPLWYLNLNAPAAIKVAIGLRIISRKTRRYIIIVRNRSCLRRFSGCEFAQFFRICFFGSEQCGQHSAVFGVWYLIICAEIADQRVVREFSLRTVRPLIPLAPPPVGRRSRPFQRGATERPAWKERLYLAPDSFGCGCAALSNAATHEYTSDNLGSVPCLCRTRRPFSGYHRIRHHRFRVEHPPPPRPIVSGDHKRHSPRYPQTPHTAGGSGGLFPAPRVQRRLA